MKAFTDISQSRKLAEILPLESADMWYDNNGESIAGRPEVRCCSFVGLASINIPCWSLAALLAVLDEPYLFKKFNTWSCYVFNPNNHRFISTDSAEPVDVCVEMILKLHEIKMF